MKLYRKKLNSVEELKRECIRLNYQKKQLDTKDLVPSLGVLGGGLGLLTGKKKEKGGNANILELGLSLINAKGPLQVALALAGPLFGLITNRKKKEVRIEKPRKKVMPTLVKEVLIGYISGKGIQLALRGAKWYLKRRREKKAIRQAELQLERAAARR